MLTTCSSRTCLDAGHLCSWMETSGLLGALRAGRTGPRGSLGHMFLRAQEDLRHSLWPSRPGGPYALRRRSCRAQVQGTGVCQRACHQGPSVSSSRAGLAPSLLGLPQGSVRWGALKRPGRSPPVPQRQEKQQQVWMAASLGDGTCFSVAGTGALGASGGGRGPPQPSSPPSPVPFGAFTASGALPGRGHTGIRHPWGGRAHAPGGNERSQRILKEAPESSNSPPGGAVREGCLGRWWWCPWGRLRGVGRGGALGRRWSPQLSGAAAVPITGTLPPQPLPGLWVQRP